MKRSRLCVNKDKLINFEIFFKLKLSPLSPNLDFKS